jgi:hypothetical protein
LYGEGSAEDPYNLDNKKAIPGSSPGTHGQPKALAKQKWKWKLQRKLKLKNNNNYNSKSQSQVPGSDADVRGSRAIDKPREGLSDPSALVKTDDNGVSIIRKGRGRPAGTKDSKPRKRRTKQEISKWSK